MRVPEILKHLHGAKKWNVGMLDPQSVEGAERQRTRDQGDGCSEQQPACRKEAECPCRYDTAGPTLITSERKQGISIVLEEEVTVFIYYYVHLNQPFETVERTLLSILSSLDGLASAAYREGEGLRTRIGIGGTSAPVVAKTVCLKVGEPLRGGTETAVPITWEATGTPGLFPSLEADIVVAAIGPDLTQVALRGSYKPPLGAFGRSLDHTVMHRVAEASVKKFVDRLALSIEHDRELQQTAQSS